MHILELDLSIRSILKPSYNPNLDLISLDNSR